MIDFVCVLFDGKRTTLPSYSREAGYSPMWVDRLFRGIQKQMPSDDWHLICLVDEDYHFESPVHKVALYDADQAWGAIMEAFRPELTARRRMILGLDTLIVGALDELVAYSGKCILPRDPYHRETICNGAGIFDLETSDRLWTEWTQNFRVWKRRAIYNGQLSEMAFLRQVVGDECDLFDALYPDQVQSYKAQWATQPATRDKARIVYFHGRPKMHEIADPELLSCWE